MNSALEGKSNLNKKLPELVIGNVVIPIPIIQGGMGVRVSTAPLVSTVSNEGGLGVIAAVGLGEEGDLSIEYTKRSSQALREQIKLTKNNTNRPFGVNIMVALTNFAELVKVADKEKVPVIFAGAGLPLKMPSYVKNKEVRLVPIVSSGRAAEIMCKVWQKRYNRLPDGFVVEGPLAGGHLGFNMDELERIEDYKLEKLVQDVIKVADFFGHTYKKNIPVIAAGGVYDGKDIAKFLKLGASGVQIATRFVCTNECEVAQEYKEAYLNAKKEDIIIIDSPVGLPGRIVRNKFVEKIERGGKIPFDCTYQCLRTCDYKNVPYCIAKALVNAYRGNMSEGFAMCGSNAYRVNKIMSVKELMRELIEKALHERN